MLYSCIAIQLQWDDASRMYRALYSLYSGFFIQTSIHQPIQIPAASVAAMSMAAGQRRSHRGERAATDAEHEAEVDKR